MKNNSPSDTGKKTFSFGASVLIHATLLIVLATATYKVAIPAGNVTVTELDVNAGGTTAAETTSAVKETQPPTQVQQPETPEKHDPPPVVTNEKSDVVAKVLPTKKESVEEKKELPMMPVENTESKVEAETETPPPQVVPAVEQLNEKITKKMQQEADSHRLQENDVTNQNPETSSSPINAPIGENVSNNPAPGSGADQPEAGLSAGSPQGVPHSASELIPLPGNPKPSYPLMARLQRKEASVTVHFTVAESGLVTNAKVVKNTGENSFSDEVLKIQKAQKYRPGKSGLFQQTYNFKLSGNEEEIPGRLRTKK